MMAGERETLLRKLDQRVERIERYLPTLATREEMHATVQEAVAPLATRAEMHAAIQDEGERTRRHMDVLVESLRDDIKLIAEGHASLDARVTRLEASRGPGRPPR